MNQIEVGSYHRITKVSEREILRCVCVSSWFERCKLYLDAVYVAVRGPERGRHGAALKIWKNACFLPEVVDPVPVRHVHARFRQERLGVERRRHEQQVAVPARRVLGVVGRSRPLGAGRAGRGGGGIAHVVDQRLAGEAEHAGEARLHDPSCEAILIRVVRRGEEGGGHGVSRDVVERTQALSSSAALAPYITSVSL